MLRRKKNSGWTKRDKMRKILSSGMLGRATGLVVTVVALVAIGASVAIEVLVVIASVVVVAVLVVGILGAGSVANVRN